MLRIAGSLFIEGLQIWFDALRLGHAGRTQTNLVGRASSKIDTEPRAILTIFSEMRWRPPLAETASPRPETPPNARTVCSPVTSRDASDAASRGTRCSPAH